MVKGAGELEVEGGFVSVECEVVGRGFEGSGGSHRSRSVRVEACDRGVHGIGLGLEDLKPSPMGNGHGADQVCFHRVARIEVGHEAVAKLGEGRERVFG